MQIKKINILDFKKLLYRLKKDNMVISPLFFYMLREKYNL